MILLNIYVVIIFLISLLHKGFSAPPNSPVKPSTSLTLYLVQDESNDQAHLINFLEGIFIQLK